MPTRKQPVKMKDDDDLPDECFDDEDICDCLDYEEDILTGRCICPDCGRVWYRIQETRHAR